MSSQYANNNLMQDSSANDEHFYDSSGLSNPDYDNVLNEVSSLPPPSSEEYDRQVEEWKVELARLEDEITTLRQVLGTKVRQSNELKKKLGITPIKELRHDVQQGLKNIKDSDAYQKTSETLHNINEKVASSEAYQKTNTALKTAGQKTSEAFTTFGAFASKKLGDVRNSNTFKSFEEKVGSAYTNVKSKVSSSKSENNIPGAMSSGGDEDEPLVSATLTPADEKVPL